MAAKNKYTSAHHIRRLHHHRVRWFIALVAGLLVVQLVAHFQAARPGEVLAYATSVSHSGLLAATNQQRSAHGLGALALNSQLNNGAQAKANHMVAKNYWSHTAPDGTEPWYFFTQAGYNYQRAGENLAYGFDNNNEIIDAWMGSAGHKANILGNYKDVGFGFTNGGSYQGGEFTVVVAFYGLAPSPPPPPPPPTPAPAKPTPKPQPSAPAPAPTPAPAPVAEPQKQAAKTPAPAPAEAQPVSTTPSAPQAEPRRITNLENLLSGNASWSMYASLTMIGATTVGFVTTHWQLVRRGWRRSAHFILVHPALDTALIVALIAALLTSTVGFIR